MQRESRFTNAADNVTASTAEEENGSEEEETENSVQLPAPQLHHSTADVIEGMYTLVTLILASEKFNALEFIR